MFVEEFFNLNDDAVDHIADMVPDFGYDGYGEFVFYRTYSRVKSDGSQETWSDVVIRVINGVMSIRKDWYLKNYIAWDEDYWQDFAFGMAKSMFNMEWLPPGRGLWAMGTPFVYERGSMCLYNCAFIKLKNSRLGADLYWLMDALMLGVGVGFEPERETLTVYRPTNTFTYIIPDSREGWANSVRLLIDSYLVRGGSKPVFDYSMIREKGLPIKGFGGTASGPDPLIAFHKRIEICFFNYMNSGGGPEYDVVRLKTDLANMAGCCVVAGNVRRSAEIATGWIDDPIFSDLKDYEKYPEREQYGWMSNNSVKLFDDAHFEMLGSVASRVTVRGEPGILNLRNFPQGRIGRNDVREDKAIGINPCGEIPLEDFELCNLSETLPTRCPNIETWFEACKYASFYSSTVSLLPTHSSETNAVIVRNRRIGVSIIDFTGWKHTIGLNKVISAMRQGYHIIREFNRELANEAGVPESIRVTTIKPGGTTPKLAGRTAGAGYPTFKYTKRATRVAKNHPIAKLLMEAGIPWETEKYDPVNTLVFYYPIIQGPAKPAEKVTLWEQAINIITLQREWSDNAVSNTLYFRPAWTLRRVIYSDFENEIMKTTMCSSGDARALIISGIPGAEDNIKDYGGFKYKGVFTDNILTCLKIYEYDPHHEEGDIENVLANCVPLIKSISLLPHTASGVYDQMPESEISEEEYNLLKRHIKPVNWSLLRDSDGIDEKYCQGANCEIPQVV